MVKTSVLNDALNAINNAEKSGKRQVLIRPSSKVIVKFLQTMQKHGALYKLLSFFCFFGGPRELEIGDELDWGTKEMGRGGGKTNFGIFDLVMAAASKSATLLLRPSTFYSSEKLKSRNLKVLACAIYTPVDFGGKSYFVIFR